MDSTARDRIPKPSPSHARPGQEPGSGQSPCSGTRLLPPLLLPAGPDPGCGRVFHVSIRRYVIDKRCSTHCPIEPVRETMLSRGIRGVGTGLLLAVLLAACTTGRSAQPPSSRPASTSSGQAAPASVPEQPTARPVGWFTLAATGDLLVHDAVAARARRYGTKTGTAYDFHPMLAPVRGALTAVDLAVCHLETPLVADDRHVSGYPTFNAPPELADAIHATGYDSCSVASN